MRIKYSPIKSNRESKIEVVSDNTISIDSECFYFPNKYLEFPDVQIITKGKISKAWYENNELWLMVPRHYINDCPWDTGSFTEVSSFTKEKVKERKTINGITRADKNENNKHALIKTFQAARDEKIQNVLWRIERYETQVNLGIEPNDTRETYLKILQYLQDLREIPKQEKFPYQITWPNL